MVDESVASDESNVDSDSDADSCNWHGVQCVSSDDSNAASDGGANACVDPGTSSSGADSGSGSSSSGTSAPSTSRPEGTSTSTAITSSSNSGGPSSADAIGGMSGRDGSTQASTPQVYTVMYGQTWQDIADDVGVELPSLLAANDIAPNQTPPPPMPGQQVVIPSGVRDACVAPENSNTVDTGSAATPLISSSNITVAGQPFVKWFNSKMVGTHGKIFGAKISESGFRNAWDNVQALCDKANVTLNEFVAHLMIMYNETGGALSGLAERGDPAYFFEERKITREDGTSFKKASYNGGGNRKAGDQLLAAGVISTPEEVAAWNGKTAYPNDAPDAVKTAARDCDFYKYRGHGLNQLTFRPAYKKCADPAITKLYGKSCDDLTTAELDAAFLRPEVYLSAFRIYNTWRGASVAPALAGNFAPYGTAVSGSSSYGTGIFTNRCVALSKDMLDASFTTS